MEREAHLNEGPILVSRMGWPGDRGSRPSGRESRKVRAPQGKVVGNTHPGQPAGQCHRKQTAALGSGKGETVVQETTSTAGDRRGSVNPTWSKVKKGPTVTAGGPARNGRPAHDPRVDCTRRPATVVPDGWSPTARSRGRTANRTRPMSQPIRTRASDLRVCLYGPCAVRQRVRNLSEFSADPRA